MPFTDFLKLVTVLKVLYGRDIAERFFQKNIDKYYDLKYDDISASVNKDKKVQIH